MTHPAPGSRGNLSVVAARGSGVSRGYMARRPAWRVMGAALGLVGLALATACANAAESTPAPPEDLVHIHRLQQSPDGETLYAATHTGLYRINGPNVERVGGAAHDLMGFTVAGQDDLLASGHPDLRDDACSSTASRPCSVWPRAAMAPSGSRCHCSAMWTSTVSWPATEPFTGSTPVAAGSW